METSELPNVPNQNTADDSEDVRRTDRLSTGELRTMLPPIGSRSHIFTPSPPPEVDKFTRAMDKVMADRALTTEPVSDENATNVIIARRESQMVAKHGISRVGKGVVEKFNAARHNTAIMSAMGHPELDKMVAKEEEEKRKRRARLKDLSLQRTTSGRSGSRSPGKGHCPSLNNTGPQQQQLQQASTAASAAAPAVETTTILPSLVQVNPLAKMSSNAGAAAGGAGPPTGLLPPPPSSPSGAGTSTGGVVGLPPAVPAGTSSSAAVATSKGDVGGGSIVRRHGEAATGGGASKKVQGTSSWGTSARAFRASGAGSGDADERGPGGAKLARNRSGNSRYRRRTQQNNPKTASGVDPVIRANSRVGRILTEFGGHSDWCSVTVMRHSLATILQANIRGWLVRRRWLANSEAVVESTKAALEAERQSAERRTALKAELERRALTRKQKEKAANVLQMLFPQKSLVGAAASAFGTGSGGVHRGGSVDSVNSSNAARAKWGRLNKNMDLVKEVESQDNSVDFLDDSDSDMSDLGVEEMAMIKMRARTPPWQKAEQSQWEGQWAKLNQKSRRGNLDVVWDLADTAARVQAVQQRRAERTAGSRNNAVSTSAFGGIDSGSMTSSSGAAPTVLLNGDAPYDPATQPLPATVVNELLVHRYIDKYTRLGLIDHMPMRTAAEAAILKQQQTEAAAAEAAAAAAAQAAAAAHLMSLGQQHTTMAVQSASAGAQPSMVPGARGGGAGDGAPAV